MYVHRKVNFKKTFLNDYFLDFHGGMKPHTSLDIELFCGTIDYAFPEEVPKEINQLNGEDELNKETFDCVRFYLPINNALSYIGNGSYRSNRPNLSGLRYIH